MICTSTIQRDFIISLAENSRTQEQRQALFSGETFKSIIADNLMEIFSAGRLTNKEEPVPEKDLEGKQFIIAFVKALMKTVPDFLLVDLILRNIEYRTGTDLSMFRMPYLKK